MKPVYGVFIEPWEFTQDQRDALILAWPDDSRRVKGASFILVVREVVEFWKTEVGKYEELSAIDMRDRASRLRAASEEMLSILSGSNDDFAIHIDAMMLEALWKARDVPGEEIHLRTLAMLEREVQRRPGRPSPDEYFHPQLSEIAPFMEWLLRKISHASKRLADSVEPKPGRDKRKEKRLIHRIADAWQGYFGKPPSASKNGNFSKFISTLAPMLDLKIGHDLVADVLKNRLPSDR